MGLFSVKHAVALVGGSVWLTADDMHTTFHLKLPAQPAPAEHCEDHACAVVDRLAAATTAFTAACAASAPTSVYTASPDPPSAAAPSLVTALSPPIDAAPVPASAAPMQGSTEESCAAIPVACRPVCIGIDDSLMLRKTQVDGTALPKAGTVGRSSGRCSG